LKKPQRLRSFDGLDGVAKQLMKTNPRLPEDKAAWLAAHWSRQGQDGRWTILGDAAHKIVNPVLTRADDVIATWGRISAPLLWVEGAGTEFGKWWGDRYTRAQFEQQQIAPQQDARYEEDAWQEIVGNFLEDKASVTVAEIAKSALTMTVDRVGTADQRRIAAILQRFGWRRGKRTEAVRPWVRHDA